MDERRLRAILLKIESRLTPDDRERLHFYIGDDAPRRIRDVASLRGTLQLMDALMDRDKIEGKDLTLLIDAFSAIRCTDAVKLLTEYRACNRSVESLSMVMPPLLRRNMSDLEDDKYPTKRIDESAMVLDDPSRMMKEKQALLSTRTIPWKHSLLLILFLLLGYGSLLFFSVRNSIEATRIKQWHDQSGKSIQKLQIRVIQFEKKTARTVRWRINGTAIAGDEWSGNASFQLNHPEGIYIDENQTLYIADTRNHRVMAWKKGAKAGQLVAGGNRVGNRTDQLDSPSDVVFDSRRSSLIICDQKNRRVTTWPHRLYMEDPTPAKDGQIRLSDTDCWGLTLDHHGLLYISNYVKHEVRRYAPGDMEGTLVAGGHGAGSAWHQLEFPTHLFVDQRLSLYVADTDNSRVMEWKKDATNGSLVAGGHGSGESLAQLSVPQGIWVDQWNDVYVVDSWNDRVMRWKKGMKRGTIIVGGNGRGSRIDQLKNPDGLFFDQNGFLYVVDCWNHRIQRFAVERR